MLDRLQGLETEYAIRYRCEEGERPPGNDVIFRAIREAIEKIVRTRPGDGGIDRHFFVENGGAFNYEAVASALGGGLVEGSTPECRGPEQLLIYQRAQENLLRRALPEARRLLRAQGHKGELLGLLKNCKDGFGNIYGTQENYEVDVAQGLSLFLFRVGLVCLAVPGAVLMAVLCLLLASVLLITLAGLVVLMLLAPIVPSCRWVLSFDDDDVGGVIGAVIDRLDAIVLWPVGFALGGLVRLLAFRRLRRTATAFLVTRPIFSGAGTLDQGRFRLSERGFSIRHSVRLSLFPEHRAIFSTGQILKPLLAPMVGVAMTAIRPILGLLGIKNPPPAPICYFTDVFRRRQRLQLGLSDANMADVSEYLKLATTTLVFDLAEAGELDDLPTLRNPIQALRTVCEDPGLNATIDTSEGPLRAIDVQRRYHDRAREIVERSHADSLDVQRLLYMWEEVLDALESSPEALFGRIDWVTKRIMLDKVEDHDRYAGPIRKKVDLRYHELGTGYFAQLQAEELSVQLAKTEQINAAVFEAPSDTPAALRAWWIKKLADGNLDGVISWRYAEVPDPERGDRARVVRLDDRRG